MLWVAKHMVLCPTVPKRKLVINNIQIHIVFEVIDVQCISNEEHACLTPCFLEDDLVHQMGVDMKSFWVLNMQYSI